MRQVSFDEAAVVGGAECGDLTMSVGLTGVSLTGSVSTWEGCMTSIYNGISDTLTGYGAHYITGIPYGEPHVA